MPRFKVVLEYDGTAFDGWQLQPGMRTIQGEVEAALATILGAPVRVHTAGRTDSGVHAKMQVVRFDAETAIAPERLRLSLDGLLPRDIGTVAVELADPKFDPRRWRHDKQYRYRWLDRGARSPLRAPYVWHVHRRLDDAAMAQAAAYLAGTHDFTSFRAAGCASVHPVRTIARSEVLRRDDEVHLEMEGTGFLRHMIRIVAGTLTEIGRGKRPPEWMAEVLAARDRTRAARTAPAQGLTLEWIRYHGPPRASAESTEVQGEEE